MVVLKDQGTLLPLRPGRRVYLVGVDSAAARQRGLVPVAEILQADAAIVRLSAPSEKLHPNFFFGGRQHEGRLEFRDGDVEYDKLRRTAKMVPTFVSVYLDRPAILTNVTDLSTTLVANFGISDDALLDFVLGAPGGHGRLPFALPASMNQVEHQAPGRPHDLDRPLFPFGAGLGKPASVDRR